MLTKRRVTIKEVAQAAGVSTQTVSRVLNDRPDVSDKTRSRIQAIIRELGYSPNVLARSLIKGRSQTIGVVGYGLGYYGPARVLTGIERRANELGYSLLLSLLREPETDRGEDLFRHLAARQVDGVIWAVPEIGANRDWAAEKLRGLSIPVVFTNMEPRAGMAVVAMDNREGGRLATDHLIQQGYSKIGIVTGPDTWWESRQRELGWRDALVAAGIPIDEQLKVAGDWYPTSGARGVETLVKRFADLDAVFACNDPMAAGALYTANRLRRASSNPLAVIGFDDVPEAAFYTPSLTTVRQPLVELGCQAVELLAHILELSETDFQAEAKNPVWIEPSLIVRESSVRNR